MPTTDAAPSFADLLTSAVNEPGKLHDGYSAFHNYSFGNQLLALFQCAGRGIEPGPIATYPRWKELGRFVRKGEKAIQLCMPITGKRTTTNDDGEADEATYTRFVYRNNWFVLAQTDGADYQPPALPDWDQTRALAALDITLTPFAALDGNCQGYACGRAIAVNPIAKHPAKTVFHELAHVVAGHTTEGAQLTDDDKTPRDLREVEAESVAYILTALLTPADTDALTAARGYLQHWLDGRDIPEANARRIFKTVDAILRAGRASESSEAANG